MDLYILRHGKAEDAGHGNTDAQRKLTKKGREEISVVAAWMAAQELEFDIIATSPLARAQETAAIVADTLLGVPHQLIVWEVLEPGNSVDDICREVDRHADLDCILLVGHEPQLSSLIGRIIAGDTGAGIAMTKGGLAKVRNFSFTRQPSGELHWLLTAKQMGVTRH